MAIIKQTGDACAFEYEPWSIMVCRHARTDDHVHHTIPASIGHAPYHVPHTRPTSLATPLIFRSLKPDARYTTGTRKARDTIRVDTTRAHISHCVFFWAAPRRAQLHQVHGCIDSLLIHLISPWAWPGPPPSRARRLDRHVQVAASAQGRATCLPVWESSGTSRLLCVLTLCVSPMGPRATTRMPLVVLTEQ